VDLWLAQPLLPWNRADYAGVDTASIVGCQPKSCRPGGVPLVRCCVGVYPKLPAAARPIGIRDQKRQVSTTQIGLPQSPNPGGPPVGFKTSTPGSVGS
jgi:hypothetical protein